VDRLRAKIAADADLLTGIADLAKIARLNAAGAITTVHAKAIVVRGITIVRQPVAAAANAIMIVRLNVVVNATSASAIVIIRRGVIQGQAPAATSDAIILRAAEIPAEAAVAVNRRKQFARGGLRPAFFISALPLFALPATARRLGLNLPRARQAQSLRLDETRA
jgi:hypothetical protein